MKRAAVQDLEPKLEALKSDLFSIFGQDVEITYDLCELYRSFLPLASDKLIRRIMVGFELNRAVRAPKVIALYIEATVEKLKAIARDELYRNAWLSAAPKGILFEVVPKLETVSGTGP
jgi:phage FluMu gp28-like protein